MRDEINISTRFQWAHSCFLTVAEVLFALQDAEEDSQRRLLRSSDLRTGDLTFLTLEELGTYHRQLFLWGWRFSLFRNAMRSGPEGSP
ncbi:hypothetical protein [Vampirovibrio chlorellavorus]|uniref:hypothetical protein n=1 Tax=Vampirovibrio chlorellavorus TaxID=758823 RepID=UPI0026EA38C8|nr:hypothetical protein [Vampirovibrio chlorellavorus]